jgi:hypothetical protein
LNATVGILKLQAGAISLIINDVYPSPSCKLNHCFARKENSVGGFGPRFDIILVDFTWPGRDAKFVLSILR